jgi:hypothetical protein
MHYRIGVEEPKEIECFKSRGANPYIAAARKPEITAGSDERYPAPVLRGR